MINKVNFDLHKDEVTMQDNTLIKTDSQEILTQLMTKLDLEEKNEADLQLQIELAQKKQNELKATLQAKKQHVSTDTQKSMDYYNLQIEVDEELNTLFKITNKTKKNTKAVKLQAVMANFETSFLKLQYAFNAGMLERIKTLFLDEFVITNRTKVSDFIKNTLKPILIARINKKYPTLKYNFDKDCKITINDLEPTAFLAGKDLQIKVDFLRTNNLEIQQIIFIAKIIYQYEKEEQLNLLNDVLIPAIPEQLLKDRNNEKYNLLVWAANEYDQLISKEVEKVIPLPWLLNKKNLAISLISEFMAGSYWTCFHAKWWGLCAKGVDNGAWQAYSIIPNLKNEIIINNKSITQIQKLFDLNQGYFNEIFNIIENTLNDMGINCRVKKKTILDRNNYSFAVAVGNLNFYNSIVSQTIKKFDATKRQFFVQVNFDVLIDDKIIEYPGVVLVLSDILKLYD